MCKNCEYDEIFESFIYFGAAELSNCVHMRDFPGRVVL